MKSTREEPLIKHFLSEYENGLWADAERVKPDAIDRSRPAVDQIATRRCDGKTLAIEHTIIEPFVGEKEDFASFFDAAFFEIEKDELLLVPGRWIRIFVPVGTLRSQPPKSRYAIVQSVHQWIKPNRLSLGDGVSQRSCTIADALGEPLGTIALEIKVVPLRSGSATEDGRLHIRRKAVEDNLGEVVENALKRKLPKLVCTIADKRILLLERQHMNPIPLRILEEMEKRRASFPDLSDIDEIWFVETFFYDGIAGRQDFLYFESYVSGELVASFAPGDIGN